MLSNLQHNSITGLAFVLLLMSVFAHIWFASTPLPLGGPNVILAGLTVFLSLSGVLLRTVEKRSKRLGASATGLSTLVEDYGPIVPVIAVSLLLFLWMLAVYLFTGTLEPVRLAQIVLGVGVLFAVYTCVDSVHRAKLMLLAFIGATFVSTLFGMAVVFIGDPFLTIWLDSTILKEKDLPVILVRGRIAGLTAHTAIFADHLIASVPFAFVAALCSPFGRGKPSQKAYDVALFVMLMTMVTGMVLNATRSAILGVVGSSVIIALLFVRVPRFRRRLFFLVPLMAVWLLAVFNPVLTVGDLASRVSRLFVGARTGSVGSSTALFNLTSRDGHPLLGHTIEGLTPSKKFAAQIRRENGGPQLGETVVAVTRDDGSLTLVWREPDDHTSRSLYQFRLRPDGEPKWGPWLSFCFLGNCSYMHSKGPPIHDLAAGAAHRRDDQTISYTITGLTPGETYQAQFRGRNEYGYGAWSQITATTADDGRLVFTWRESDDPVSVTAYQLRLRFPRETAWRPWRDCGSFKTIIYGPPPPRITKLGVGLHTLVDRSAGPSIGYSIEMRPNMKYRVQLRTRNAHAFGSETEFTVVTPDDGNMVFTWLEPDARENITAYQFRLRSFGASEWRPWRDFLPSLSSGQPTGFPDGQYGKYALGSPLIRSDYIVYAQSNSLVYISEECANTDAKFFLHVIPFDLSTLPEDRKGYNFDNLDFNFTDYAISRSGRCIALRPLPHYRIRGIRTGQYTAEGYLWKGVYPTDESSAAGEMAWAHSFSNLTDYQMKETMRIFRFSDWSAHSRILTTIVALRYSLDHPLGTGIYSPSTSHYPSGELSTEAVNDLLHLWPHNYFLYMLVLFGFPGLVLLILFYVLVLRSIIHSGRSVIRSQDVDLYFLVAANGGAVAAYLTFSLLNPTGPFINYWGQFFIIGLVFSLQRIAASHKANE